MDPVKTTAVTDENGNFDVTVTVGGGPGIKNVTASASVGNDPAGGGAQSSSSQVSEPGSAPTTTQAPSTTSAPTTTPAPTTTSGTAQLTINPLEGLDRIRVTWSASNDFPAGGSVDFKFRFNGQVPTVNGSPVDLTWTINGVPGQPGVINATPPGLELGDVVTIANLQPSTSITIQNNSGSTIYTD